MERETLAKVLRLDRLVHLFFLRLEVCIETTLIDCRGCIGWGASEHRDFLEQDVLAADVLGPQGSWLEITRHMMVFYFTIGLPLEDDTTLISASSSVYIVYEGVSSCATLLIFA